MLLLLGLFRGTFQLLNISCVGNVVNLLVTFAKATSQDCPSHRVWTIIMFAPPPHCSLWLLRGLNLTFGKLPLVTLSLGKSTLGKYLIIIAFSIQIMPKAVCYEWILSLHIHIIQSLLSCRYLKINQSLDIYWFYVGFKLRPKMLFFHFQYVQENE